MSAAPTARVVFDRANSQMETQQRMLGRLSLLRGEAIPLPMTRSPSILAELIRHWIQELACADHAAQASKPETWAQAFERVHGEGLA